MQKIRLLILTILCSTFGFSQFAEFSIESALNSPITFGEPEYGTEGVTEGTLYSNGPFYNVAGSPNVSMLQDATLLMGTYGFGHALTTGYRVADDWVVTADVEVESFQFYAYQTGSSTTSTINHVSLAIWDGDPSNPASTIIWGDQTTNVFTSSEWSGAYRQLESAPGATDRPIMITTVETPGLTLAPGTYWIDWNTGGTLGSGPWAPAIAITGQSTTGNAKQFDTVSWVDLVDVGPQGLPFEVNGEEVGGGGGGNCELDGDTTTGEIWDRPLETGTGMSGVGIGVRYNVYGPFTVDTAGVYTINSVQTGWDGFLFVYQDNFDPNDPLTNFVAGDDDGPGGVGNSQVTPNLATGTDYFIITTGFDPSDFGPYTTTITGPGTYTCDGGGGGGGDDLLIIDLSTENQVTITATTAASAATTSGGTTTGFLFENFFAAAGTQAIGTTTYVGTPTLTAASVPTDNSPALFRSGNTDAGMNIWSYSATSPTTFTEGSQAFTGEATWSITPELYAAMLTAPENGNIYFPADSSDDIPSATLLGTYSVIMPGGGEPGGECDITYDGSLEDGLGALNTLALAADFNIAADESMSVERVTLNILGNTTSVNVSFHDDAAGTPGTQIAAPVSIVPTSQTLVGTVNGFNVYETVLDLPSAQNFEGGATGANFWIAISTVVGTEGVNNYWEFSNSINNGTNFFYSVDAGATWADAGPAGFIEDGAFILEGTCGGEEPGDNDECAGAIAVSCGDTVTGTTADATDSGFNASPDRFYSFTGDGTVQNVTVSLCGSSYDTYLRVFSDCTLSNEIIFNDDFCGLQSQVTFESDGTSTYIIMVEGFSANSGAYTMAVTCATPPDTGEPDYPCFQGDGLFSNGFENGYNVTAGGTFRNADDFIVDDTFTMQYVRLNLFMLPGDTASSVTFNVRADEGGAPSESNIVDTFTAIPTSQAVLGSNFGYDISQVEFILDADRPELPAGTYWLQPEVTNGGGVAFWEVTSTGSLGGFIHTSEAGGPWNSDPDSMQAVFFVAGECNDTPVEDCSQDTPSNDFENGHGNLHLLRVANDFVVEENTMFTVDQFKFNVILPAGATVDALDFYFFEDSGAGPGTEVQSEMLVVPTSVEMVGTLSSFEVYTVTVDLPTAYTFNGTTSGDTNYWLGIMVYTGAANSYWEGTSILNTPNEGYLELDGVWASISSTFGSAPFDGVFEISGTCETLGISDMDSFDFAYYPNPVKDVLNITSNKPVENVAVFNLAGQKVLANAQVSNGEINVSALPAGVYVFKATLQGGQVETFKIIKK